MTEFLPRNGAVLPEHPARNEAHNQVAMRNDLVRAVHRIDLHGKRLLMLAMSRLDSRTKYKQAETETIITVAEYQEVFGGENTWRDLQLAADEIFEVQVVFDTSTATKRRYKRARWCAEVEYCPDEAHVVVVFSRAVLPFLCVLKEKFTTYRLENVKKLRSIYSWRLFELLMQWKGRGMMEIEIEKLQECLEVPDSCKRDFGEMRKRVLVPAIKELEKSANMEIMWNPKKRGRRVASVLFGWTEKKQPDLF